MLYRLNYLSQNKNKIKNPIFPIVRNLGFFVFKSCYFLQHLLQKTNSFLCKEKSVFRLKHITLRIYQRWNKNILCFRDIAYQHKQNILCFRNIAQRHNKNILCLCDIAHQHKQNALCFRNIAHQREQNVLCFCSLYLSAFEYRNRHCKYLHINTK